MSKIQLKMCNSCNDSLAIEGEDKCESCKVPVISIVEKMRHYQELHNQIWIKLDKLFWENREFK